MMQPRPKLDLVRSEAYRRYVAALPCWLCGRHGGSQAAHADEGKGAHLKTSDLTCYPLCAPHDGLPGCHHDIGSSGIFSREERRQIEHVAALHTKTALLHEARFDRRLAQLLAELGVAP